MSLPEDFRQWTPEETSQYLEKEEGLERWKDTFKDNNITGEMLPDLTVVTLKVMGITDPGDCEKILLCISKLLPPSKVFNDPIHGHMELHPLLVRIINTPQFQRLRNIKQLGGAYYVYPGASHNRFEHSIGVGHLAGELVKALRTRQPELDIDNRDILCVQIAGLCHDLGHGPFSHLFDGMFIPRARPEKKEEEPWKHETASCKMFDHMVERNELKPLMEKYGLVLSEDLIFIKEMIEPEEDTVPLSHYTWPYKGREKNKSFLYEIVSNKRNGVDVDKFDYFARDCHQLGLQTNFDHLRFFKFARVCEVDGWRQICVRDKEEDNMTEMFHTRYCLHRRAYQHKANKIIERMIADAFLKADEHIKIEGSEGKTFTLSTAIDDMEAYTKLTDNVFEQILNSTSTQPHLQGAREILERITSRDLYKFLGETRAETTMTISDMERELAKLSPSNTANEGLKQEDFVVMEIKMDCGMKDKDPIDEMNFYSKDDPTRATKRKAGEVSRIRPMCFSEKLIRFYCKKTDDESFEAAKENFATLLILLSRATLRRRRLSETQEEESLIPRS